MKTFNQLLVAIAVLALTACGSQTARSVAGGALTGGTGSTGSTGSEDTSGNINNLPQAPSQVVTVSGNGGPYPTGSFRASTSHMLKIKVSAMPAQNLTIPGYTTWSFPYGCMQVTVSVNGMTQTTQVLRVGSAYQGSTSTCANAPTSQTLDFSNATTGSGSVLISVTNPQYDNCRHQWPNDYGCSVIPVWSNHLVSANITTQVDGTWMDP